MQKYSEEWWAGQPPTHVRCHATRKNGEKGQCKKPAMLGGVVCESHGGAAKQVRRRAAERIAMAQDDAAAKLVQWMKDETVDIGQRIKVAQDLLNRGGLSGKTEIEVNVKPWEGLVNGLLVDFEDDEPDTGDGAASLPASDLRAPIRGEVIDVTEIQPKTPSYLLAEGR